MTSEITCLIGGQDLKLHIIDILWRGNGCLK
jgi:hypothetical protein